MTSTPQRWMESSEMDGMIIHHTPKYPIQKVKLLQARYKRQQVGPNPCNPTLSVMQRGFILPKYSIGCLLQSPNTLLGKGNKKGYEGEIPKSVKVSFD